MLFVDGPFVTAYDLSLIDSEFEAVANAENVNVDGSSSSVLYHYMIAAGAEFTGRIQNFSGYLVGVGVNSNHLAAVLNILSTAINRPRALLNQITVKEPNETRTAFVRWVRYYCLHDFYRSVALKRVTQERYALKMQMFAAERDRHFRILINNGFPVVLSPMSCPGAIWDYGAGIWDATNVAAVAGGTDTGADYDVSITWCNLPTYVSTYNQNGGESGPSAIITQTVTADHLLQININNLNPPTGLMQPAIGTAQGVYSPQQATNWNVYVGKKGGNRYLQNSAPIPLATTTFLCGGPPTLSGFVQNQGQPAQYDFTMMNVLFRG